MIDTRAHWRHQVLTSAFVAESCAFADMTGDGVDDLVAGPYRWPLTDHETPGPTTQFRETPPAWLPPWGGGSRPDPHAHLRATGGNPPQYRAATYDWPIRTGKGRPDSLLSVGMHQDLIRHYRRGDDTDWTASEVTGGGIYESATYTPLDTDGTHGLVTVPARPRIAWYEPDSDPTAPWIEHPVGEHGGNWHGLGVGAIGTDDQPHILTPLGAYTPADDIRAPWQWTPLFVENAPAPLAGLGDVAGIHAHRFGDHPATLFGASPHGRGCWRFDLLDADTRRRLYRRHTVEAVTSQLHALAVLPATADEPCDAWVITGKRWHAHGPHHDIDPAATPVLLRIGVHADPALSPRVELIDDHSGVGLHFAARRLPDGRMQIATANKLGVHLFTHTPGGPA
ncbi:MAG: repeat protein [Nocardia sp.]|uniref:hypothetical protein n=1 Tax=Nocardia sp. TaxID=1821 RepID=UPI00263A0DF7|nr:hypothetical protein [Nocardia sp.]MCU1644040.1 repeat protein [Nocardia sp.]